MVRQKTEFILKSLVKIFTRNTVLFSWQQACLANSHVLSKEDGVNDGEYASSLRVFSSSSFTRLSVCLMLFMFFAMLVADVATGQQVGKGNPTGTVDVASTASTEPITDLATPKALVAGVTAGSLTLFSEHKHGTLIVTGDSVQVVTLAASFPDNILTHRTRVHWDSGAFSYAHGSFVTGASNIPLPDNATQATSSSATPTNIIGIFRDTQDYDDDPTTDTYLEAYWDNAWDSNPVAIEQAILNPSQQVLHVFDLSVEPGFAGTESTINTSGDYFTQSTGAGVPATGGLKVSNPALTFALAGTPEQVTPVADVTTETFGVSFNAPLSVSATSTVEGEPVRIFPVSVATLRWFWDRDEIESPTYSMTASQLASLLDITVSATQLGYPTVQRDLEDLDNDASTDTYIELELTGDFMNWWSSSPIDWATLAFETTSKFGPSTWVNTQVVFDVIPVNGSVSMPDATYIVPPTPGKRGAPQAVSIRVKQPTATGTITASGPTGTIDSSKPTQDKFVISSTSEITVKHDYPLPDHASVRIFYDDTKVVIPDTPKVTSGSGWNQNWTTFPSPTNDTNNLDGDPTTNVYVKLPLVATGTYDPSTSSLVDVTFKATQGFIDGYTKLNVQADLLSEGVVLSLDTSPIKVKGPTLYPTVLKGITVVGPTTESNSKSNGPWYIGLTPDGCDASTKPQQILDAFSELIEITGTVTWASGKLTATGLVNADIPGEPGELGYFEELFDGTMTFDYAAGSTNADVATGVQSVLVLGGAVEVAPTELELGDIQNGPKATDTVPGIQVDAHLIYDGVTLPIDTKDILAVTATGWTFGAVSITATQPFTFKPGPLELEFSKFSFTYDGPSDTFKITGEAQFAWMGSGDDDEGSGDEDEGSGDEDDGGDAPEVTINFSDDDDAGGFLEISGGKMYARGTIKATNIPPLGAFQLKDAEFDMDTLDDKYGGKLTICFPPIDEDDPTICMIAGLGFLEGKLNSFDIGFVDQIPLGDSGAFFQSAELTADNLANQKQSVVFGGTVKFSYGDKLTIKLPSVLGGDQSGSVGTLTITCKVDEYGIAITKGEADLVTDVIASADVTGSITWLKPPAGDNPLELPGPGIDLKMTQQILDGLISGTLGAGLGWSKPWNMSIYGDMEVAVPKDVPIIGGDSLGEGGAYLHFREGHSSSSLVAAWADIFLLGEKGFQVTFDGDLSLIGGGTIDSFKAATGMSFVTTASASNASHVFVVPEHDSKDKAPPWATFSSRWAGLAGAVDFQLTDPAGNAYTQTTLGDDITLVKNVADANTGKTLDAGGPTSFTLHVASPMPGNWTLTLLDTSNLGTLDSTQCVAQGAVLNDGICFSGYVAHETPQMLLIKGVTPTSDDGHTLRVDFDAQGHSAASKMAMYYADDAQGTNARLMRTGPIDPNKGYVIWDARDVKPGLYHIYGLIHGGGHIPHQHFLGEAVRVGSEGKREVRDTGAAPKTAGAMALSGQTEGLTRMNVAAAIPTPASVLGFGSAVAMSKGAPSNLDGLVVAIADADANVYVFAYDKWTDWSPSPYKITSTAEDVQVVWLDVTAPIAGSTSPYYITIYTNPTMPSATVDLYTATAPTGPWTLVELGESVTSVAVAGELIAKGSGSQVTLSNLAGTEVAQLTNGTVSIFAEKSSAAVNPGSFGFTSTRFWFALNQYGDGSMYLLSFPTADPFAAPIVPDIPGWPMNSAEWTKTSGQVQMVMSDDLMLFRNRPPNKPCDDYPSFYLSSITGLDATFLLGTSWNIQANLPLHWQSTKTDNPYVPTAPDWSQPAWAVDGSSFVLGQLGGEATYYPATGEGPYTLTLTTAAAAKDLTRVGVSGDWILLASPEANTAYLYQYAGDGPPVEQYFFAPKMGAYPVQ